MIIQDVLARFNRKERYWVVQTALGEAAKHPSRAFCKALEKAFKGADPIVPSAAWWAMDYHIDWLYAALDIFLTGRALTKDGIDLTFPVGVSSDKCVMAQQEDIDLVVAHGRDVFLIEAKAFAAWDTRQMRSKLDRIDQLAARIGVSSNVRLHLALLSHGKPTRLRKNVAALEGRFTNMDLIVAPGDYFAVGRSRTPSSGWRVEWSKTM